MATLNAGSGADGNATVSADTNISTTSLVGRSYADMVPYQCTSVGANSCVTSATPDGIEAGDEVLLINWQGVSDDYNQVGNYETFIVDNVNTNTITFTTDKTKYYGDTSSTDACAGGTATASDFVSGNPASNAFDNNTGTSWRCLNIASNWIKYEMASAKIIVRYSLTNSSWVAGSITAWELQGSNNDSDWTTLDTRSGVTSWSATETKTYNCTTVGSYLYYRLDVNGVIDGGGEGMMSEIQMFEGTDTGIGTSSSDQRVRVQRVPQYNNLTIDNGYSLTANDAWDTGTGGILFLRAAGTILVNGAIDMTGKGYTGGYNNYSGSWYYRTGASYNGGPRSALKSTTSWWYTSNLGGGARGGHNGSKWACGAGGGYGTAGEDGDDALNVPETQGGSTYGEETLSKLFLGSGGGSSEEPGEESGDVLADGGGILALFATTLDVYGSILCDGQTSVPVPSLQNQPGGAGSGGSILIHAGTIYTRSSTFNAIGAIGDTTPQPGSWKGGDGGDGRIAIHYATLGDSLASVDPVPYTDSGLQLPYKIQGTASEDCTVRVYDVSWVFVKSQAVSAGAYEISNLPSAGPFNVISEADASGRNLISYKAVTPAQ